jgi:hypothetical protein
LKRLRKSGMDEAEIGFLNFLVIHPVLIYHQLAAVLADVCWQLWGLQTPE